MDHRQVLKANHDQLIQTIDIVHSQLWDYLLQYGVVDQAAASSIRAENSAPDKQISALLDYVMRKPATCYTSFRQALFQSNQSHVLREILPPFEFAQEVSIQTDVGGLDVDRWQEDSRRYAEARTAMSKMSGDLKLLSDECQEQALSPEQLKIKELEETNRQHERDLQEARQMAGMKDAELASLKEKHQSFSLNTTPVLLNSPLLELSLEMQGARPMLGLAHQGALIGIGSPAGRELVQLSRDGSVVRTRYRGEAPITAILPQEDTVLVLDRDGCITRRRMHELSRATHTWRVDVVSLEGGAALSRDQLVCVDYDRGQVFTCTLKTKGKVDKQVKVTGLNTPTSVACAGEGDSTVVAVVCESGEHRVCVYDAHWRPTTAIGGEGSADEKLTQSYCCIFLPSGNLLFTDLSNNRVAEFTCDGRFVRHWLTKKDGVTQPVAVSFLFPHLWVVHGNYFDKKVSRYKMYP